MTSPERPRDNRVRPSDPTDLLPANSVLDLDDYIDMYDAIGNRTRYEILYRLVHNGGMTFSEMSENLSADSKALDSHIERLLDTGLIQRRQRTETGDTTISTYYRATINGEVVLTEGIEELICGEQEFSAMYNSSVEDR